MEINANNIYQQMQGMISEVKGLEQPLDLNPVQSSSSDFATMLKQAVDGVNSMQLQSKDMQQRFEMGDPSLSLAEVMLTKEKAGIGFEATVQVRNKVLEAYKQIMNMPV